MLFESVFCQKVFLMNVTCVYCHYKVSEKNDSYWPTKVDQFHKMSLNSQRIVIDSCAATLNGENNCFFYSTYSSATNTSSVVRCLTRFPWKRKPWTLSSPEHS